MTIILNIASASGGYARFDTLVSIENVQGSEFADQLTGDGGENTLKGLGDADILRGLGGDDDLIGGSGGDKLTGGMGKDELAGNSGNDTFIFNSVAESPAGNARDVIDDFEQGSDVIDLTSIDADVTGGGLSDPFTFIGTTPFDNIAGELRYSFESGNTVVEGDVNGDSTADFQIELVSQIALTASDFLL